MIKLLGIGSSPRSADKHAMHDSLSSVMLQDVLAAAREASEDCETEIIQLARLSDGSRKMMGLHEIVGMEGDMITMQEIFAYKMMGLTDDRQVKGRFVTSGIRPKFMTRLEEMGVNLPSQLFRENI